MLQNVNQKSGKWAEEALDIHGLIYEKMSRIHRRTRMNAEDHIILDSKLLITAGAMAAAIIDRSSVEGVNDLTASTEEGLLPAVIAWADDLIHLHASIYTMMMKNYRRPRISPEDETMLDTKLFESASLMAVSLFNRSTRMVAPQ
ncbi:MAG: hypothetical protein CL472_03355 [Acidobacteria bacterium]|nr:hypothetical protein [Acidobacteriota bacterium]